MRHYPRIRISHCTTPDCPEPSIDDGGECMKHKQERFEKNARYLAHVVGDPLNPCRHCGDPIGDLRTECEACRHLVPDTVEEP